MVSENESVVFCRQVNIDINKSEYLAHVNGEPHKRNLSAMANGLQSNRSTAGPLIMDAVGSAASLMMLSNGNGVHAANNIATEEYFHVPSPMPRAARSAVPHFISRAPSTTSIARELGQSMGNLNLNGKLMDKVRAKSHNIHFY